jgi:rubrerythrin
MSLFEPSEVFQFAIRIEENGEKFYRKMADKFSDPQIKELFSYLADEETKHKRIYEGMVENIEKYEPFESYPGEYFEYLRAYADKIIFDEKALDELQKKINDPIMAINVAMDNEVASILYYQEIKNIVPQDKRSSIDKIMEEERRHFVTLSGMRSNMSKK